MQSHPYKLVDYSKLDDQELIIFLCCQQILGCWRLMKVVGTTTLDDETLGAMVHTFGGLTQDGLNQLYLTCPNPELLESLEWVRLRWGGLSGELNRRLEKNPLSNELLRYEVNRLGKESWMTPLFKYLGVEEIKAYSAGIETPLDHKMFAAEDAEEHHMEIAEKSLFKLSEKITFSDLLPDWERLEDIFLRRGEFFRKQMADLIETSLRKLMPALLGELDRTTPEAVHRAYEARKRRQGRIEERRERGDLERLEIKSLLGSSPEEAKQPHLEKWEKMGKEPPNDRETRRPVIRPGMKRTNLGFHLEIIRASQDKGYLLQLIRDYRNDPGITRKHREFLDAYVQTEGNMSATCKLLRYSRTIGYQRLEKVIGVLLKKNKKTKPQS